MVDDFDKIFDKWLPQDVVENGNVIVGLEVSLSGEKYDSALGTINVGKPLCEPTLEDDEASLQVRCREVRMFRCERLRCTRGEKGRVPEGRLW